MAVRDKDWPVRNRVILGLEPEARAFVVERLLTREMFAGETIYFEGAPITHMVFPHSGVISLLTEIEGGKGVETASIGFEGFIGFALALGTGAAVRRSVVQVRGYASWLAVRDLDEAMSRFPAIREAKLRYAEALLVQAMQSAACNATHSSEARVVRWLLGVHDRITGDRFEITQQTVADLLGLRRATVSEACSSLERRGLIEHPRGGVRIVNRRQLEALACTCYGKIRDVLGLPKRDGGDEVDPLPAEGPPLPDTHP